MQGRRRAASRSGRERRSLGAIVVVLLAGAGIAGFVYIRGTGTAAPQAAPLPTNVTSEQTVGLANLGPQASSPVRMLTPAPAGLAFADAAASGQAAQDQQWQADQMGDGSYVFVYLPDGECLASWYGRGRASAGLVTCGVGVSQRWAHPYLGKDASGRGYWQLRSAADGQCLTAGQTRPGTAPVMRPCGSSAEWQQLI